MGRQGTIERARTGAARAALLAVAAVVTFGGIAGPAHAATGTHTISVLPDASALELSTYPGSTPVTVEVERNGVTLATASLTTDGAGDAAVNGGTMDCWSDATPDIMPGDVVQVSGPGFVDTKTVDDITSSRPVQTGPGTVVVHGHGQTADGTPLPVESIETRIIGSAKDRFANGRRDLRAGGTNEYPLVQDAGNPTAFTATFSGLSSADVSKVLSSIEVREIFTDTEDPSQTIATSPSARGPAPPCSTPMRRDAITRANHAAVNAANVGSDLVLSGVTQNADAVTVNLDDESGRRVTIHATVSMPSGAQTFTATVPADRVGALRDGTLTASATYTIGGMDISGGDLSLVKDTVVPPAPTATPGPRTYLGPQSVTLSDDDATAKIHWTAGTATPTADSPAFTTPILVTASQVIRALAVDRAGNASPVSAFSFEIAVPVVPAPGNAAPQPSATPTVTPGSAVAGTQAASVLRVRGLALGGRIRAAPLRRDGLRLSLTVPADAAVVRVAVSRASGS